MTLLAFSVGAVVFGQVYSATLRQGATDQAAFADGHGPPGPEPRRRGALLDARCSRRCCDGELGHGPRHPADGPRVRARPPRRHTFILVGHRRPRDRRPRGLARATSPACDQAALGAAIDLAGRVAARAPAAARRRRASVSIDVDYDGDADPPLDRSSSDADGAVRYVPLGELAPGTADDVRRPLRPRASSRRCRRTSRSGWSRPRPARGERRDRPAAAARSRAIARRAT